jgi:hypothetical protein
MKLPRFSLRLLLLAVAVLCAWLAWERSVVVRRRVARSRLEELGARVRVFDGVVDAFADPFLGPPRKARIPSVPWLRALLGDEPIESIELPEQDFSFDQARSVSRRFPEALVTRSPPIPDGPLDAFLLDPQRLVD